MTKDQLERGSDIEYEISQLKRHRPDGEGRVKIKINEHTVFHEGLEFVTGQEDMAMSVYAKAKRNLDPKKYMVSLEIPKEEQKPRHLGSC